MASYLIKEKSEHGSREPSCFDFPAIEADVNKILNDDKNDMLIVYGLYALLDQKLMDLATVKIFIDTDADIRMGRWITRDIILPEKANPALKSQEKTKLKALMNVYLNKSRVEMAKYVKGTKDNADVILPNASEMGGIRLVLDGLDPLIRRNLATKYGTDELDTSTESILPGPGEESVHEMLKNAQKGPTVSSLGDDNFRVTRRFYDMN